LYEYHNQILNILNLTQIKLDENNFNHALLGIDKALRELESIPEQFFEMKTKLSLEIKNKEEEFNKKFKLYKVQKIKEYKALINKKILELNKILLPNNTESIKNQIESINYFISQIPKLFISELIDEKSLLNKNLIKAQNYLLQQEISSFKLKKSIIEKLIERFHKLKIDKRIDDLLITYNEIILEFQKLPELFFEEKVELFKEINNLYGSINNLIVKNNISTFYEAYNYSKTLEEVEEYFEYIYKTKKVNPETLDLISEKLKTLPSKYYLEKNQLEKQLKSLYQICKNQKSNLTSKESILKNNNNNKNILEEEKVITPNKIKTNQNSDLYVNFDNLKINPNLKKELISYYEKLKKSNNPNELKIAYNKLIFYIKLANLGLEERKKIISNLNKIINSKKLN